MTPWDYCRQVRIKFAARDWDLRQPIQKELPFYFAPGNTDAAWTFCIISYKNNRKCFKLTTLYHYIMNRHVDILAYFKACPQKKPFRIGWNGQVKILSVTLPNKKLRPSSKSTKWVTLKQSTAPSLFIMLLHPDLQPSLATTAIRTPSHHSFTPIYLILAWQWSTVRTMTFIQNYAPKSLSPQGPSQTLPGPAPRSNWVWSNSPWSLR